MSSTEMQVFGWTAYGNGILTVVNMITLGLMFGVSMAWGRVNDAISVVWMLSFLPLAVLLVQVNQSVMGRGVAVGTAVVGAVAMVVFAVLQILLTLKQVTFEQTFAAVIITGGVMGLWLAANGLLALKGATVPTGLAWISVAFGLSYALGAVGYFSGGYESPILWVGAAAGYVLGPIWAFWLGRLVLSGRLGSAVAAAVGGL